jgi:hypothetical protein
MEEKLVCPNGCDRRMAWGRAVDEKTVFVYLTYGMSISIKIAWCSQCGWVDVLDWERVENDVEPDDGWVGEE